MTNESCGKDVNIKELLEDFPSGISGIQDFRHLVVGDTVDIINELLQIALGDLSLAKDEGIEQFEYFKEITLGNWNQLPTKEKKKIVDDINNKRSLRFFWRALATLIDGKSSQIVGLTEWIRRVSVRCHRSLWEKEIVLGVLWCFVNEKDLLEGKISAPPGIDLMKALGMLAVYKKMGKVIYKIETPIMFRKKQ